MENNKHEISKESVLSILIIPLIHKMKNEFPEYKEQIKIVNMIYDDRFNIELGNGITLKFVRPEISGNWYCSYGIGCCSLLIENKDIHFITIPSPETCPDCTDADIRRLRYFFFDIIIRNDEWVNRHTGRFTYANNTPTCQNKEENGMTIPDIKNVFFNEVKKATTVVFNDHTSVVVKCAENDTFDPEIGLAMALTKRCLVPGPNCRRSLISGLQAVHPRTNSLERKLSVRLRKKLPRLSILKHRLNHTWNKYL